MERVQHVIDDEEAGALPESTIHASLGTYPHAPPQTFAQASKRSTSTDVFVLLAALPSIQLSHFLGIPEFWDGLVYSTIASVGIVFMSDKRPTFARFLLLWFSFGHISILQKLLVRFLGIQGLLGVLMSVMIVSVVSPIIIVTMNNFLGNPLGEAEGHV